MIYGYARVSTEDQNLDLQIQALKEAGAEKIYGERISGVKAIRPEMISMLDAVKSGDTVIVWKLDRLSRSLKDLILTIESFNERGIHFKSLTEGFDTTKAQGRLIFSIFGALAEFERELIRERVNAGLKAAKKRGQRLGRPNALTVGKKETILNLMAAGMELKEIAKTVGVSRTTLWRFLNDNSETQFTAENRSEI